MVIPSLADEDSTSVGEHSSNSINSSTTSEAFNRSFDLSRLKLEEDELPFAS